MNKFFILCVLAAVASAAAPKTYADCEKQFIDKAKPTKADGCKGCRHAKKDSAACKKQTNDLDITKLARAVNCGAVLQCYKDIDDAAKKAEKKAQKDMEAKFAKFCPTEKAKCVNKDNNCAAWAAKNPSECTKNPDWMLANCQMSCCPVCTGVNTLKTGTCPSKKRADLCVKNTHSSCHAWATQKVSECTKNAKWMKTNCMQSCCAPCKFDANKCPTVKETCENKYKKPNKKKGNEACVNWAKNGECKANANWMNSNCAKECCAICAAKQPAAQQPQAVRYVQQPVYNQPFAPVPRFGGYSNVLPYAGR